MADAFQTTLSLLGIHLIGVKLVSNITKYLSTLTQPVDTIEELVAVCSVTSSLLLTLNTTVVRFYKSNDSTPPFIQPLCHDILAALSQFAQRMQEAREMKVFEPNSAGFVRLPKYAWALVMGGEVPMAQLRNRLYVEKYRARVLIDAVAWQGLHGIGRMGRTDDEEKEMERLTKMLPLIADRLMGVWKDYQPRITGTGQGISGRTGNSTVKGNSSTGVQCKEDTVESGILPNPEVERSGSIHGFHESPSTTSLASTTSTTSGASTLASSKSRLCASDPIIYERWALRESTFSSTLASSTTFLGLVIKKKYTHRPGYHYVKPLPSHLSEVNLLLDSKFASESMLKREILKLSDGAQSEIQKLLEKREEASSDDGAKRHFELVALLRQPRRRIDSEANKGKFWLWRKRKHTGPMEWILLIRGRTLDHNVRITPVKDGNPWNPKPKVVYPLPPRVILPGPSRMPQRKVLPASATPGKAAPSGPFMMRHVQQKPGMTVEEAERRMEELYGGLFATPKEKGETSECQGGHDGEKVDFEDKENPFD